MTFCKKYTRNKLSIETRFEEEEEDEEQGVVKYREKISEERHLLRKSRR